MPNVAVLIDAENVLPVYAHQIFENAAARGTICAKEIYGAAEVKYSAEARREINNFEKMGYGSMPVCVAKTQYSLSDDEKKLGRPTDFEINIREVYLSAGAGFVVAVTGSIMTMPGLPKAPAAFNIDVDSNGTIVGLF